MERTSGQVFGRHPPEKEAPRKSGRQITTTATASNYAASHRAPRDYEDLKQRLSQAMELTGTKQLKKLECKIEASASKRHYGRAARDAGSNLPEWQPRMVHGAEKTRHCQTWNMLARPLPP